MKAETPRRIHRKDYRPPAHRVDRIDLSFHLAEDETRVRARMEVRRDAGDDGAPLVLDGEDLDLREVRLNGSKLAIGEFEVGERTLSVPRVPDRFELETEVAIRPQENTRLMGLYRSHGNYCTQCEAEGFRRITYYPDRPDVMARFTTRIEADAERCPVLLSNGNRVAHGTLAGGRHWVKWEDPFPKPSYLFALVAGDLVCHRGEFTTRSGRSVPLEIWVEPRNAERCEHAMRSLKKAMKWDEDVFGLELDLDVYMVVAVDDFNMGAMENKGLNIFNSKFVLADPQTATDDDYESIEGVIGHEYFHNWTGNRVTCRDWFQLTLKEGLTVYRDQRFTADMTSAPVKRVQDVAVLRTAQFAEDAGPMAHPIRPESYVEMNNFYTSTVYQKGAEVVRMYETLLGREGFRKGLDLYFERHDGQAVTCDDFRAAMADANGVDLSGLEGWYSQAGTPVVEARGEYDDRARTYRLSLSQSCPRTTDGPEPRPVHVPVRMGLIGTTGANRGRDLPLRLDGETENGATTRVLDLREAEQSFTFVGVDSPPVPSLLRGFSAPVKLKLERGREELAFLMANDSDAFSRWDAGQELAKRLLLGLVADHAAGRELVMDPAFADAFGAVLDDPELDGSMKALALTLPNERVLGQEMDVIDPDAIHAARRFVVRGLARALRDRLREVYDASASSGPHAIDKTSIDRRRLRNRALGYLVSLETPETTGLAARQFAEADNMTDCEDALACLLEVEGAERDEAVERFYERWKDEPLVVDKWFGLQARSSLPSTFERVVELSRHPAFTLRNPNRARSLLGAFAVGNQVRFHAADGEPYAFLAERVLELDALNPQVASRIASAFNAWKRFDEVRQGHARAQLERIADHPGLSRDVGEIVGRALGR